MTSVFLLGATGYVGGSLLVALKSAYPDVRITALVRSPAHDAAIRAAGAEPIRGTFADLDLVTEQSKRADVVINVGDCDTFELTDAILRGIKAKSAGGDRGGKLGILIHTSGDGIYSSDRKDGKAWADTKIWNDNDEEDIKALTVSMPHGQVDVPILKAGEEGYVHTYIICPSIIHGQGSGPVSTTSLFHKAAVKAALEERAVQYIGEGSNLAEAVHITDVISLFLIIFKLALSGPPSSSPYARYYNCSAESFTVKPLFDAMAVALHTEGKITLPEPQVVPLENAAFVTQYLAMNVRMLSERSLALGWKPRGPSIVETVAEDMKTLLV